MKKILYGVVALFLCAIVAFVACYFAIPEFNAFVKGDIKSWGDNSDGGKTDDNDKEIDGYEIMDNVMFSDEGQDSRVSFLISTIPVDLYRDYNIAPFAESAYVLQAIVTPAENVSNEFTWSAKFKDPSSSWASDKSVGNYIRLGVTGLYNRSCTVTCLDAFAEPVEVSITYKDDISLTSTVQVDYIKRISNVTVSGFNSLKFNSGTAQQLSLKATYGVGTVEGTFTFEEVWGEFAEKVELDITGDKCFKYFSPLDSGRFGDSASFYYSTKSTGYEVSATSFNLTYQSFWRLGDEFDLSDEAADYMKACMCLAAGGSNVLRACISYTYGYADKVLASTTAYSEYGKIDLNNLRNRFFTVDDVNIDSPGIYF